MNDCCFYGSLSNFSGSLANAYGAQIKYRIVRAMNGLTNEWFAADFLLFTAEFLHK